jgi:hypothetical protein
MLGYIAGAALLLWFSGAGFLFAWLMWVDPDVLWDDDDLWDDETDVL